MNEARTQWLQVASDRLEADHPRWVTIERRLDGIAWRNNATGLTIIASAEMIDRDRWLHVSVSLRSGRTPTWEQMSQVKRLIVGPDRYAYMVHPPENLYVDEVVPGQLPVLHWWALLEGETGQLLPEFSSISVERVRTI